MDEIREMLLDVKLDLKDVKNENFKNWASWVKCYVKIDAVECFPCYLKIGFYHEDDLHNPFSIIRLNIPGVRTGPAASRTKSFTYGIFWKNNRKRERLFLAFQDKQSCTTHETFLKKSIDSLEQYRKAILENHRISRSVINAAKQDESQLDSSKQSLNDTQTERDLNDILGPLPDIPSCGDSGNRFSLRRSSGCSGIYEEILDPSEIAIRRDQEARGSISSGIYVEMSTPLELTGGFVHELPPPLPPRRPVHPSSNLQIESTVKTRKSAWNLRIFGRKGTTDSTKNAKQTEVVKSQTTGVISSMCRIDCQSDLLTNCKNSFSTPDLTNIAEPSKPASVPRKSEGDESDFDVIERSNSLNCSTNQFVGRPPTLNISDNILWSHNLSLTLSSSADSSAINLVGANVNSRDSFLARDSLGGRESMGYCKMTPILNINEHFKLMRTSTTNFDEQPSQQLESASIYCAMAPILPKSELAMKNITFERTFDLDEDRPSSLFDCSLKSIEHSNHGSSSLSDITTSSGVSSDDGNVAAIMSMRCTTPTNVPHDDLHNDDAISLTYTESPPQSAQSEIMENPFIFHKSKFDQKTPSYFPNENVVTVPETTKYTLNLKSPKPHSKNGRKKTDPLAIPVHKEGEHPQAAIPHFNQPQIFIKQTCKGVLKTPTKVQKTKQRRCTISESTTEQNPSSAYKNENIYQSSSARRTYQPTETKKFQTLPASFDSKNVLANLDPNTKYEPTRHASLGKNSKGLKIKSSPRNIYNKILRLRTPPCSPTDLTPEDRLNSSLDSAMRTNPDLHMSTSSDGSRNGLIRTISWARFRKIDFSPLKTKINNILQRPNHAEY